MRRKTKHFKLGVAAGTLLLGLMAWGCAPATTTTETPTLVTEAPTPTEPESQPTEEAAPTEEQTTEPPVGPEWCDTLDIPTPEIPTTWQTDPDQPYYVPDQVTLTGIGEDIEVVVNSQAISGSLTFLDEVTLGVPPEIGETFVARLYRINPNPEEPRTVWELILAIYEEQLPDEVFKVFADPNYIINPITGDPYRGEGSPYRGEGSSGGTAIPIPDALTMTGGFLNQWAFNEDQGIGLFNNAGPPDRNGGTGEDIPVGVFDTAPFDADGYYPLSYDGGGDDVLGLCVSLPDPVVVLEQGVVYEGFNQHGLFVSGLVHGVAPGSQVHLVRVLDENAQGDMFTLIKSMAFFADQVLGGGQGIINLSLGFQLEKSVLPENIIFFYNAQEDAEGNLRTPPQNTLPLRYRMTDQEEIPVLALKIAVAVLQDHGAVIVAASGNNGGDSYQLPAIWPEVIGVGATDQLKEASCFSNAGDVYAPGGQGVGENCEPVSACNESDGLSCEQYGVISMVRKKDPPDPTRLDLALWNGTSFSTPQVSGLVALLLQLGVGPDSLESIADYGEFPSITQ